MKQRWLRSLFTLFPASVDSTHRAEMLDCLEDAQPRGRAVLRETLALLWAAGVSWRSYLRTPQGLRRSAFFGALLWFSVLLGAGPWSRLRLLQESAPEWPQWQSASGIFTAAAVVLTLFVLVLVLRSRFVAVVLVVVGIVLAALSSRIGSWQTAESLWYELRWLGLAAVLVVGLHGGRSARWLVIPSLGVAVVSWAMFVTPWNSGRNYGMLLGYGLREDLSAIASRGIWQWISFFVVVALIVVPWFVPALAAMAAPMALHLTVVGGLSGLPLLAGVVVLLSWRSVWVDAKPKLKAFLLRRLLD